LAIHLSVPGLLFAMPAPQIFVLHSYTHEYPWTHDQHEGFIQALAAEGQVEPIVSTEYLNTKRRAYDEAYANEIARHFRIKYADYNPTSIYVTDDNALLFARDYLPRIFPDTPIFFSGVNDYAILNSLDSSLFTGVFEEKEVGPNLDWLLRMDKDANDLVFIGDGSNTYQAIEREARKALEQYPIRATFVAEKRLDKALALLGDLPGKYLFLTTLGGMTDANDNVLPLRETMRSLAQTGRIVISMEDVYIIEGVLGGYVTSGQKQGMSAAQLLVAYLRGEAIADLAPILKSPNTFIFDDRVIRQNGLELPDDLRVKAILLNPRMGFYRQYRTVILGSLVGLAVLLFLVIAGSLLFLTQKNRELNVARKSAESANTRFNEIAEQSRTVHWEINAEGLYTSISDVSEALVGYRPEDIVGKKYFHDLHMAEVIEAVARREPFRDIENKMQSKDGRLIWCASNGIPILDSNGNYKGYRGSDIDITERKRTEVELLRRSEFEQLVAEISSEIARMSGGDIDPVLNRALASIGAFTAADRAYVFQFKNNGTHVDNTYEWCADGVEPQIHNLKNIPVADELPWFVEQVRKHDIFQVSDVGVLQPEARLEREHFQAQGIKSLIVIPMKPLGQLTGFIGFDVITEYRNWSEDDKSLLRFIGETFSHVIERERGEEERKKLQTQLIQAQKMESIGTLAGGIAHDFNNILSSIIGFTELALGEAEKNSSIEESLREVYAAGNRAKELVRQILAFARKSGEETKPVKLQAIAEEIIHLLRSSIPASIEIITKFDSTGLIMGNPAQLHQIVMNLCANAAHAMEEKGGTLTISTRDVDYDQTPLAGNLLKRGRKYVRLKVSDTGTGIPPEIIDSIFDPYFTTKKTGEGTGMGLAMVQGIVESYGGQITVDSKLDEGSTFTIYLPLTTQSATQREHEPEILPPGNERILLVDDEAPIVKMSSRMLEGLGYQVTARFSSTDALELFKARPTDFDLVVTDMTMPDMSGDELAIEMMKIRSDIPVILCTGYSKRISDESVYDLGIKALVNKPFVRADLAKAVRNVLDENKAA